MSLRNKFRIVANPAQCYKAMEELAKVGTPHALVLKPGFALAPEEGDDWAGTVWPDSIEGSLADDPGVVEIVEEALRRSPVNTVLIEKMGD